MCPILFIVIWNVYKKKEQQKSNRSPMVAVKFTCNHVRLENDTGPAGPTGSTINRTEGLCGQPIRSNLCQIVIYMFFKPVHC